MYLHDTWPDITAAQIGFIVSLAQAGACVGALFAGTLSDRVGRRPVIFLADILFTLGSLMMWIAPSIPFLMAGRFVVGVGVGIASMIVPVYLAEVSPNEIRGAVISINILVLTSGQFISSVVSLLLGRNWRLMLGLAGVPSAIQFVGMLFMPESQRWLAKKQEKEKCMAAIKTIYNEEQVDL